MITYRIAGIDVEVVRKDIKNMHLRVQPPDGHVVVSAPTGVSDTAVKGFIAAKLGWIRRQRKDIEDQARFTERGGVSGETMYVWGKQCYLSVAENSHYHIEINGRNAVFFVRAGSTAKQREAFLREWYRAQLCCEVEKLLPLWEKRTGLYCAEWKTKYMKTLWGSCNPKDKRIWFNVQLAKHPANCLEYIILHELAHLKDKTHGPVFTAILDEHMPDWRAVQKELNAETLDYIER